MEKFLSLTVWNPRTIMQSCFAMKVLPKYLLLCALIALFSGNAAGEFFPRKGNFTCTFRISRFLFLYLKIRS